LGIECDGASYHSANSVRDRDRLRQEILENKGWSIHGIWSTNWFHSRSSEIDRLKRVLDSKLEEDRRTYVVVEESEEIAEAVREEVFSSDEEIDQEIEDEGVLLDEALERFWSQNIQRHWQINFSTPQEFWKILTKPLRHFSRTQRNVT
jgi:hypothetical protein